MPAPLRLSDYHPRPREAVRDAMRERGWQDLSDPNVWETLNRTESERATRRYTRAFWAQVLVIALVLAGLFYLVSLPS